MTKEEKIAILKDIIDGEIIHPQVRRDVGIWAIKALEQSSYNSVKTELKSCTDAISRQSAIFLASDLKQDLPDDEHLTDMVMAHNEGVSEYQTQLSLLPPVTPQPKTGHWIAQDIHNCHTDFKCSACGYIHSFMHIYGEPTADYTYCPNCGAKMQEVEV